MKIWFSSIFFFLLPLAGYARPNTDTILYRDTDAARYVNPFIGTAGTGYTFPGAVMPWGMVSAGPHTTYTTPPGYLFGQTIAPAGYYYGEPRIDGFGQTHISGVACNELGAPVVAVNVRKLTPGHYASAYSEEIAKAGYYSVMLDDMKTRVSITTTQRTACYRFEFTGQGPFYVVLDAYRNLSWAKKKGYVEKIDDQTFYGWSQTGNFCHQGNEQKVYFCVKAVNPAVNSGIWKSKSRLPDAHRAAGRVGAWLSWETAGTVEVAVGISYVSMENAELNLRTETDGKNFETILRDNIEAWDSVLGRVKILDKDREQEKEIFYTALYHALLHPNVVSDVNGAYPLYEQEGTGINKHDPRYGLFSLWDTYRNLHALLSLLYPQRQQEMLYTLEDMTLQAGHAPRWELYGSEINLMVGDPAVSVLSEGVVKGFSLKHPQKLFSVLYRNATDKNSSWRPGNREYLEHGYIPEKTKGVWGSVSTTLEYSYQDWALSQFAKSTGHKAQADSLVAQSHRWRILFDKQSGLVRPKNKDGEWVSGFDPAAMDDSRWVALFVKDHGGPGFVEGNAYQYTFMVPHDVLGLVDMFGSVNAFGKHLKNIFEEGHFTLANEPDMIYPYLLGVDPGLKTYMQHQIQHYRSHCFSFAPDGLPGNDDAGALSAWYVFTALGFYPVNPAGGTYALGIPLFRDIRVKIPGRGTLLRISADFDVRKKQWNRVLFNGEPLRDLSLSHEKILQGGDLEFSGNRNIRK